MNYITKNNVIVIAQGVSKQSRKDQRPVKLQTKSIDVHTNKRARPPIISKFDFTLSNNCGREQLRPRNNLSFRSFHKTQTH